MKNRINLRVLSIIAASVLLTVVLLLSVHITVHRQFSVFVSEKTVSNYALSAEQIAYKFDTVLDDLFALSRYIERYPDVHQAMGQGFLDYVTSSNLTNMLSRVCSYNDSIERIMLVMPERIYFNRVSNRNVLSLIYPGLTPESIRHTQLWNDLEDGGGRGILRQGRADPGLSWIGAEEMLFCASFPLETGEKAIVLMHLKSDWLERLWGADALSVYNEDGALIYGPGPEKAGLPYTTVTQNGWTLEYRISGDDHPAMQLLKGMLSRVLIFCIVLALVIGGLLASFASRGIRKQFSDLALPSREKNMRFALLLYALTVIVLPLAIYTMTANYTMSESARQMIESSAGEAFDSTHDNMTLMMSKYEQLIRRIMFDADIYGRVAGPTEPDPSFEQAIEDHLSVTNMFLLVRLFDVQGGLIYENAAFGAPDADTVHQFELKMVNQLLRAKPDLQLSAGNRYWLSYYIKLYEIPEFDSAGFMQIGIPEEQISRVLTGNRTNEFSEVFLVDADGCIVSCANYDLIGETIASKGEEQRVFTAPIAGTGLRLMALYRPQGFDLNLTAWMFLMIIGMLIGLLVIYVVVVNRLMSARLSSVRLERNKRVLEIQTLQNQISPHFLCNTLETIRCLVDERQTEGASRMIVLLSNLFKLGISRESNQISVREELSYAKSYLELINIRFDNRITHHWKIDERLINHSILKLTLQPIIENSVQHSLNHVDSLVIEVELKEEEGDLHFIVTDNGVGIAPDTLAAIDESISRGELRDHIGLVNVSQRLKLHYGPQYGLRIETSPGSGTSIHIFCPKTKFTH